MRSRFIARLTDIAFQASPPRGVGMLRLVSNFAIWLAPHRLEDRLPPTKTYGSAGRRALESHVIQITMNTPESPAIMEIGITGGTFSPGSRASNGMTALQGSVPFPPASRS
jgi:hypothetical protein